MVLIEKVINFMTYNQLFVSQLTVMDISYLDYDHGIVGDSWIVDLVLKGSLDDQGMIMDFGLIKKQLKKAIDQSVDHTFLIPKQMPGLRIKDSEHIHFVNEREQWFLDYSAPSEAFTFLEHECITDDAVLAYLLPVLYSVVPHTVVDIEVSLRRESIKGPFFHYSHGLQQHDGDCQRMVHGHRSRIEVFSGNDQNHSLESKLAQWLNKKYLLTDYHIIETLTKDDKDYVTIQYSASQGDFQLTVPISHCIFLPTATTIENIAFFLAKSLNDETTHPFTLYVFEGVGKGAIADGPIIS